jgi:hypothetical protein
MMQHANVRPLGARLREVAKRSLLAVWDRSLHQALQEQQLDGLAAQLAGIVPDLSDIRTNYGVTRSSLAMRHRGLDAFQMTLLDDIVRQFNSMMVVDIGDSSGRHMLYLQGLYPEVRFETLSMNVDPAAVRRVQSKGLRAVRDSAERLPRYAQHIDLLLCFELLEHLPDPHGFLRTMSYSTDAAYLVATVPYVPTSRIGLEHLRQGRGGGGSAENTHFFELNPVDWELLARQSGWAVVRARRYYQYPRRHPYRWTRLLWRRYDYEGFLGLVLRRDHTHSDRYGAWSGGTGEEVTPSGP